MARESRLARYSTSTAVACATVAATSLAAAAFAAADAASIARQDGAELRFITCPVYRDTDAGIKSGCWLADDPASGLRYDVSLAPTKPDWNHEILVEGRAIDGPPQACGGIVLQPVRVSVLPGSCTRARLPAEGHAGRPFTLPARNVRPLSEARPRPSPPFADRSFHVLFDFDRDFIVYQLSDFLLDEAITYIRAVDPARVRVVGYAATLPTMVSGRSIAERPAIARRRAESISEALRRLGVPAGKIDTEWRESATPVGATGADGLSEPSRRRVDILVDVD